MTSLSCPLCSVALGPGSLEGHLREELAQPALRCLLCPTTFASAAAARRHFEPSPLATHPGAPPQLMELAGDPAKDQRLLELLRLARGGREAVQQRLCVCGHCQLFCREDFPGTSGGAQQSYESHNFAATSAGEMEAQAMVEQVGHWQEAGQKAQYQPEVVPSHAASEAESEEKADEALREDTVEHQPMPEASEPENQMMQDVKPNLEDLKPQLSADGKVACVQCGLRVAKERFKDHALGAHSSVRPFSCNLCPHNEKSKGLMGLHLRKEHKQQLSSETFTFVGSETKIADLVEQCFGAAKDVDWARMRCGPCDKLINKMELKNHAAAVHLKRPLHVCLSCGFQKMELSAGNMNKHVKKQHKRQPGPDTVDSSQAQHYAPIIKNMIPQLFSQE